MTGHASAAWSVAWSPDGPRLAASGSIDGSVRLWDAVTGAGAADVGAPAVG
ncbi:MAG: hypothetical protein IPJ15_06795 [Actinomycetales bacterium]|nr:hypothetical protein [Candidatus Phosphoribacter baldrii]